MNAIIRNLEAKFIEERKAKFAESDAGQKPGARFKGEDFRVGDTVDVHVRIIEGEKERTQIFNGVVIDKSGGGLNEAFTVRRLVSGEGVERVFPLHAPRVEKVEIKRRGKTHRAKLFYLRDRVGKATRLREETRPSRMLPAGHPASHMKKESAAPVVAAPAAPVAATPAAPAADAPAAE